jgi:ribosomal protein S18 acetylase RimI-like enzyme
VSTTTHSHPLDTPVRSSLLGPHAHFAEHRGRVARYPADVSPFVALPDEPDQASWDDVADLVGPGAVALVTDLAGSPPADWEVVTQIPGVQLVDHNVAAALADEAVRLGTADVAEMLDLVDRTRPGPFLRRTIEMGVFLGIRRGGALVAMAGERLHPAGYTEISAVCTDAGFRGQGLGSTLVLAVAAGIHARGETPFLHAAGTNVNAIRLYESLGFAPRREIVFTVLHAPTGPLGSDGPKDLVRIH